MGNKLKIILLSFSLGILLGTLITQYVLNYYSKGRANAVYALGLEELGGLGLKVSVQRYPEHIRTTELLLDCAVTAEARKTFPLFVKTVQEDGHMAWSSPVYVRKANS